MAQIQVEAASKSCCPTNFARSTYDSCLLLGKSKKTCAKLCYCILVDGTCPEGYTKDILENSGASVNEFCKMGCASSVCDALISISNSDANKIVNGAVEQCTKACSSFCNKGSLAGVEAA